MQTFSVTTATDKDAATLMDFLTTIPGIDTIDLDRQTVHFAHKNGTSTNDEKEPYDWINPTRPATDEEWEEMIVEAENEYKEGRGIPAKEARALNDKAIAKWLQSNETHIHTKG